jgi:histidinol phosphatase-like PHP family hydrolase
MYDFKQVLTGNYLFHVHTDYTDGKLSVENVCEFAKKQGFDSVIFTEHIRSEPTYDYTQFAKRVLRAGEEYGLKRVLREWKPRFFLQDN